MSGYLLNQKALTLLVDALDTPSCLPRARTDEDDVMLAHCLWTIGITPHDTRDSRGAERFLPFTLDQHLRITPDPNDWYFRYSIGLRYGFECCSESGITFRNLDAASMHRDHALLHRCSPVHNQTAGS